MSRKVYIVGATLGDYEPEEWTVKAFLSPQRAKALREQAQGEATAIYFKWYERDKVRLEREDDWKPFPQRRNRFDPKHSRTSGEWMDVTYYVDEVDLDEAVQ